jgi:hypothetical protein
MFNVVLFGDLIRSSKDICCKRADNVHMVEEFHGLPLWGGAGRSHCRYQGGGSGPPNGCFEVIGGEVWTPQRLF